MSDPDQQEREQEAADRAYSKLARLWIQDKSNGVFRGVFGISPDEALVIFGLPLAYWLIADNTNLQFNILAAGVICGVALLVARETERHHTPFIITAQFTRIIYNRLYVMPIKGLSAVVWPGIDDISDEPLDPSRNSFDEEMGVIHRSDNEKATIIQTFDRKSTTYNAAAWVEAAIDFAEAYEDTIAIDEADFSIYVHSTDAKADEATADMDQFVDKAIQETEPKLYADEASEHYGEQLDSAGATEDAVYIAVSAGLDDATDSFRGNITARRYGERDSRVMQELRSRTKSALSLARKIGSNETEPELLTGTEAGSVIREFWNRTSDSEADAVDATTAKVGGEPLEAHPDITSARANRIREDNPGEYDTTDELEIDEEAVLPDRVYQAAHRIRDGIENTADVIASAPREFIWGPEYIDEHGSYVKVGDQYTTSLWLASAPERPEIGIISELKEMSSVRFTLAMHVDAPNTHDTAERLLGLIKRLNFFREEAEGSNDDVRAGEASSFRQKVIALRNIILGNGAYEDQKPADVGLYVTLRADSKEELDEMREDFVERAGMGNLDLSFVTARGYQKHALRSTAPTGEDTLNPAYRSRIGEFIRDLANVNLYLGVDTNYTVPADTLGCLIPSTGGVRNDDHGIIYGIAQAVHPRVGVARPAGILRIAREELSAPHRYFIGRTGAGKTFFVTANLIMELLISRLPGRTRKRSVIIDIAENFDGVVKMFGGQKFTASEDILNPFAVEKGGLPLRAVVNLITDMLMIYLRENATEEFANTAKPVISRTVRATFSERSDITDDPETHRHPSPTFEDYFDLLADLEDEDNEELRRRLSLRETDTEADIYREVAGELLVRLTAFQEDNEFDFLVADPKIEAEREASIDPDAPVVLFDMSEYSDREGAAKPMIARAILSTVFRWSKLRDDMIVCVVDEAHDVFDSAGQAERFEAIVRAGRNAGIYFDFMSQADEDFNADSARIIAKQTGLAGAFNLGTVGDVETVKDVLGVKRHVASWICGDLEEGRSGEPYSEGVFSTDSGVYRTRFTVSSIMSAIITYRESRDGNWGDYLDTAVRGSTGSGSASPESPVGAVEDGAEPPEREQSQENEDEGQPPADSEKAEAEAPA